MSHAHHSAAVYMHVLEVEPEDIDFMGHVNNASYLRWIQDAVLAHWHRTAGSDAVAAHAWVALKHEITYRQPAFLNDKIIAVVTLEEVRRHSAFYRTIIKRGAKYWPAPNRDGVALIGLRCVLRGCLLRSSRGFLAILIDQWSSADPSIEASAAWLLSGCRGAM